MAAKIRSVNPWIPVAEFAEEIGEDERYIRGRLIKLESDGIMECKKHGNTLFFRPITKPQ
jgi:DNA-binding transcriptional regulator PaaX